MTIVNSQSNLGLASICDDGQRDWSTLVESLKLCFCGDFALLDTRTGYLVRPSDRLPAGDFHGCIEVCREVLNRCHPEIIAEEDPVVLLALPILNEERPRHVALAPFLIRSSNDATVGRALAKLGCCDRESAQWSSKQTAWDSRRLLHLAELTTSRWASDVSARRTQNEVNDLSAHLAAAYEELSLLYGLTQRLRISASIEELGQKALEWLAEAITAEGFVLELLPAATEEHDGAPTPHRESLFLKFGHAAIDRYQFARMIEHLDLKNQTKPLIINDAMRRGSNWPVPTVRQAVIVPLTEGSNLFGWLAALNSDPPEEFGSSEASLLSSVAAILGIHAGNLELYRQQAEFLAGVVRALTSAIDAKDPYTCGHSDRVARISVRLANQMGLAAKDLETIYLSGLLHDIGKIGIDDHILRKPGKLSQAEYEHIKLHSEIGYRILKDLRQFGQVLPAVRHHHEALDGTGYPMGLAGNEIPLFARIVAVADAVDAMTSDRPYRKGMSDDKLDDVLRGGAGTQWDDRVIEAFFEVREEIRLISRPDESAVGEVGVLT